MKGGRPESVDGISPPGSRSGEGQVCPNFALLFIPFAHWANPMGNWILPLLLKENKPNVNQDVLLPFYLDCVPNANYCSIVRFLI